MNFLADFKDFSFCMISLFPSSYLPNYLVVHYYIPTYACFFLLKLSFCVRLFSHQAIYYILTWLLRHETTLQCNSSTRTKIRWEIICSVEFGVIFSDYTYVVHSYSTGSTVVVLLLNVVVKRGGGKWTTELQSPLPPLRETSLPKHTLDFYKSSNNSFTRSDRPFMKPSDMQPLTMARFITHTRVKNF